MFTLREGEDWTTMEEYSVTASLSTFVETTAEKHTARGRSLLDIELWSLHPSHSFEVALANSTHTILLFPAGGICVDIPLAASAAALCPDARPLYVGKREGEQLLTTRRLVIQRKDTRTARGAWVVQEAQSQIELYSFLCVYHPLFQGPITMMSALSSSTLTKISRLPRWAVA